MNILVVGAGYVGVANAILLSKENSIYINDIDQEKLINIKNRDFSFINEYSIEVNFQKLDISITSDLKVAKECDVVLIALPTDLNGEGKLDYSGVINSIRDIRKINPKIEIIIKSTLPIGSCKILHSEFGDFFYMPEFLREGFAIHDVMYPDRIVIGTNKEDISVIEKLYKTNNKVIITGYGEAEFIKLMSNTYLALRVAFFNELDTAILSEGLNEREIIDGICSDKRIGNYYNNPSFGYGGYCLPKDTKEIEKSFNNYELPILSSISKSNYKRVEDLSEDIIKKGYKIIGVYSLSSKSESSNVKESSTIKLINNLEEKGLEILIYSDESILGYKCVKSIEELVKRSDIIIANRVNSELLPYVDKIYTRDIYGRN
jgi:UDPglucose 6-dehydrogenase